MIPRAILSDRIEEYIKGRRVIAAIFLTFEFDPGFFEQEVLPILLDLSVSHAPAIRLVQLEDALRDCAGNVAVFYDADRLVNGSKSAHLDVHRIPVRHTTGVFHPKNIMLLVEDRKADDTGHRAQALLAGALSANLTRSGWWENVEACHFEEIPERSATRMKDDLWDFFRLLTQKTNAGSALQPVETIRKFLSGTEQRMRRTSDQNLFTHFYAGTESFPDFLQQCAGELLQGLYLEIISPYLGEAPTSGPLEELISRFQPKEVRIFLPRNRDGSAACSAAIFTSIAEMDGVSWGRMPGAVLSGGSAKDTPPRFVHAKVYRFFSQKPKREFCFVGSVNLTQSAHAKKGNWETGFLVDVDCARAPDFWLEIDKAKPTRFKPSDDTDPAESGGTPLMVRYYWDRGVAECYWDHADDSPSLRLEMRGVALCEVGPLSSRVWTPFTAAVAEQLAAQLKETSFLEVFGYGNQGGLLLVQEEGMAQKPSLLLNLTAADILRYWALLTSDQRAAFLEAKTLDLGLDQEGAELLARTKIDWGSQTFFDRCAGVFHAFSCLENAVHEKLSTKPPRESDADYRLFGKKYDSLGTLLDRVFDDSTLADDVERYILMLCAKQVVQELRREFPDYWRERKAQSQALESTLERTQEIRNRLAQSETHQDMAEFLDWFDAWFLKRAKTEETA